MANSMDRDLRKARRVTWIVTAANLLVMLMNLWQHYWFQALTCAVWMFSCPAMLLNLNAQQRTRDQGRLIEAAHDRLREEME